MASIGFYILAIGCDLKVLFVDEDRHRSVVNSGWNYADFSFPADLQHFIGTGIGGKIEVIHGHPQQSVSHAPPNEIGFESVMLQ